MGKQTRSSGSISVYFCSRDQPIRSCDAVLKFYFNDDTLFSTLHTQAAKSVGVERDQMVLKDTHGAIWPEARTIKDEIKDKHATLPTIRLAP